MKLTLSMALPDGLLNPNRAKRGAWFHKAKAARKNLARSQAENASLTALSDEKMKAPRWRAAMIQATFFLPDRRGLTADADNRIASLKGTLDGIADSGIMENDRGFLWKSPPILHAVDGANPRLEITVEEVSIAEI